MKPKMYINNQEIDNWKEVTGIGFDDEVVSYDLPDYLLINTKGVEKIIMDLSDDDIDALRSVFRIDLDKFVGKKVRVFFEPLGPAKPGR